MLLASLTLLLLITDTSATVTVNVQDTTNVHPGDSITYTWTADASDPSQIHIRLQVTGTLAHIGTGQALSNNGGASGTRTYPLDASLAPGQYQLNAFFTGTNSAGQPHETPLATSNTFQVLGTSTSSPPSSDVGSQSTSSQSSSIRTTGTSQSSSTSTSQSSSTTTGQSSINTTSQSSGSQNTVGETSQTDELTPAPSSSASSQPTTVSTSSKSKTGIIVGAILGTLAGTLLLLAILFFVCCYRRKRNSHSNNNGKTSPEIMMKLIIPQTGATTPTPFTSSPQSTDQERPWRSSISKRSPSNNSDPVSSNSGSVDRALAERMAALETTLQNQMSITVAENARLREEIALMRDTPPSYPGEPLRGP